MSGSHIGGPPPAPQNDERRATPRFELTAYVDYTGSEILLYHRIENIGLGGICIQTASVEEVGTIVEVVINFPDLDASVQLTGEVVWANHEPPQDLGIRYIDLNGERKELLRQHIQAVQSRSSRSDGGQPAGG